MSENTDIVRHRIDGLLEDVLAEVEYLPELAEIWEEMDEGERFAAAYDWDLVIAGDYIVSLHRRRAAGEFTPEQERRYAHLKDRLHKMVPILERLDLRVPEELLE